MSKSAPFSVNHNGTHAPHLFSYSKSLILSKVAFYFYKDKENQDWLGSICKQKLQNRVVGVFNIQLNQVPSITIS